ncbi:unnamed protein product [Prorocentrum cordatum]|uniref:Uncharacterized protein n=1 Tax=Prorocentrum cordatum TaxID=2364126 RepID=A0ABN9V9E0_9DINO|nr:unnamed protein product [Polarella glacialis]
MTNRATSSCMVTTSTVSDSANLTATSTASSTSASCSSTGVVESVSATSSSATLCATQSSSPVRPAQGEQWHDGDSSTVLSVPRRPGRGLRRPARVASAARPPSCAWPVSQIHHLPPPCFQCFGAALGDPPVRRS